METSKTTIRPIMCASKDRDGNIEWIFVNPPFLECGTHKKNVFPSKIDDYFPDILCLCGFSKTEKICDDAIISIVSFTNKEVMGFYKKLKSNNSQLSNLFDGLLSVFPQNLKAITMLFMLLHTNSKVVLTEVERNEIIKTLKG